MAYNNRINNLKRLETNRKILRHNATDAEKTLWRYIRKEKLSGRKFRRQFSILNYILDFYCFEEKIAIELDGQQHYTEDGRKRDAERDEFLREQGITVLRFENKRVFEVWRVCLQKLKPASPLRHCVTPPLKGEGRCRNYIAAHNSRPPPRGTTGG